MSLARPLMVLGALEVALVALLEVEARRPDSERPAEQRALRRVLIERASIALWHFIVQREACGLRDMRSVLRDYRVPSEVVARMGVFPDGEGQKQVDESPKRGA